MAPSTYTKKIILLATLLLSQNSCIKLQKIIILVKDTIVVTGTFDGKNNIYRWTGKGNCTQKESMRPMFILKNNSQLRNIIIEGAPDGIHIEGNNVTLDNIQMPDVCEDAITIEKGNSNITIAGSRFENCKDKALQITDGNNVMIRNNTFRNCGTPILLKKGTGFNASLNTFLNVRTAAKVICPKQVTLSRNTVDRADFGFIFEGKNCIANKTGNIFNNIKFAKERRIVKREEFADERLRAILDIYDESRIGEKYLNCIKSSLSEDEFSRIKLQKVSLSSAEIKWYERFLASMAKINGNLVRIEADFGIRPDKSIEVVFGNLNGQDGSTYQLHRICIDLSVWAKNYKLKDPSAPAKITSTLKHEYAHLLTKQLTAYQEFKPLSHKEMVLKELYYEGIGHYYSLNDRWIDKDGALTSYAQDTLRKLSPIFQKHFSKIWAGDESQALLQNMNSGNFSEKWGALTIALWLAKETKQDSAKLRSWFEKGPNGILGLARHQGIN